MNGADAPFWQESLDVLLRRLAVDRHGIDGAEAERRRAKFGRNTVGKASRAAALREFLSFLLNPLVLVLLVASALMGILGDLTNAGIIALIVLLSVALNVVQALRSQRAAAALRRLVTAHATLLRNRRWTELPFADVVPGDIAHLAAGDLVPADGRLLDATDLVVNQAPLTGESFPASKVAADLPAGSTARGVDEAVNAVFHGTSVVSGTATLVVVRTGAATELGRIGERLRRPAPETEFERGMRGFSLLITRTVIVLVAVVFLINTLARHDLLDSFLFSVALAVGLTPEFLPMIISVALAQGALRMARHKVIVKHLPSIENFGSMDILCTDKTGTLTEGNVRVEGYVDGEGRTDPRVLQLACLNSAYQTGITSPLDQAIAACRPADLSDAQRVGEIPFDFVRRRLSVVLALNGETILITKGAPESLLPFCVALARGESAVPLDGQARVAVQDHFTQLSAQGCRLLAVASRPVARQPAYSVADERDLTLAGFVTFLDPPTETVAASLADLARDGVTAKVLTGDNELVTQHVARQVGLEADRVVLGSELATVPDEALGPLAERTAIFARVSPDQKHRVIRALQSRGHVVGFLGDGINDAPSLRSADVGISVSTAVDIAKDAADIILLERSLRVLHDGVIEGRRSFANILKYILVGTSSNFGNSLSMAGGSLLLPFLPALPAQLLLNNLLYDLSESTIPGDHVDADALVKPRRWDIRLIQRFMLVLGPITSCFDFLTFFVMLQVFHADPALFRTGWFIESLAVQTLVIFVIRTTGNPLRGRPGRPLIASVAICLAIAAAFTLLPIGRVLGFVSPPPPFFALVAGMVLAYLALADLVKRHLYRRVLR